MQKKLTFLKKIIKFVLRRYGAQYFAWRILLKINRGSAIKPCEDKVNILALSAHRFRSDLKILAETGRFNIITMPVDEQLAIPSYYEGGSALKSRMLRKILSIVCTKKKVDLVLATTFWYQSDSSWGKAAEEIGVPFVAFHKECYKTEPQHLQMTVKRAKSISDKFVGTHIIVHNQHIKNVLVDSKFITESDITVAGCMRMDEFVEKINSNENNTKNQVTLFSFSPGIGLDGFVNGQWPTNPYLGWVDLFRQVHVSFARAAIENPDVEFIIKPKWGGQWIDRIHNALEAEGLFLARIKNLSITIDASAQDLILNSKVVCGFQSTTTLEAAIANKVVIVPNFAEVKHPLYQEYVKLSNDFDIYDVANSPDDLVRLISASLKEAVVNASVIAKRRRLFGEWISSLEGDSTDKYVSKILDVIEQKHVVT